MTFLPTKAIHGNLEKELITLQLFNYLITIIVDNINDLTSKRQKMGTWMNILFDLYINDKFVAFFFSLFLFPRE